jgi:trehalose 6-phosphate phosphatase
MSDLWQRIDELAHVPVLLVASDYDGTLAPIVSDPTQARPQRESLIALRALAAMHNTHVAIISGRALSDLASQTGAPPEFRLVGSHGSEFEPGYASRMPAELQELRRKLGVELAGIVGRCPRAWLEEKPAALAFHYRNADPTAADAAVTAIMAGPGAWSGVHVRHGKRVVELSVVETNKGAALERVRRQVGASAALYLGDDITDEDAFATLAGPDIGVKVGPGETRAAFRLADSTEVARLLARLAEQRAAWLAGASAVPIERHSLLSDQRAFALATPNGRITWMCVPRLDSAAVFADLLGGPTAGYFEIAAADNVPARSVRYVGDSFVLETAWPGFRVIDYLDCSGGRAFQRAGRTDLLRVIEGTGRVRIVFAPRLDYSRTATGIRVHPNGLEVEGGSDPMVLFAPGVNWTIRSEGPHQLASAEVSVADRPLVLELRYGTANLDAPPLAEPQRRQQTERFWTGWAATLKVPGVAPDLVRRSALVLKALCYGPTGAIAAAATTSLPEQIGGVRNWDYRYCWPRDAAMASAALVRLGTTGLAMKFLDWVLGVLDRIDEPHRLAPVYTVSGGHLGPEAEITHLAGYCGSRPVRVGNAASQQVQLDVAGAIAELVAMLAAGGAPLSGDHWRLMEMMVSAVEHRWHEPDHGIWEPRRPKQHHVHSKVMCWQTVDRGLKVAAYLGRERPAWSDLRDRIAADVLLKGWNPTLNAFAATYEDSQPDAATLSVGLSGLLPPGDPRFISTVETVGRALRVGPGVYRYKYDDGLPGTEGAFLLCTSWLIESLALIGRHREAEDLFGQFAALAGPTGLLAEEYDPAAQRALGNHPQAYSHLGLINAAVRLAESAGR